MPMCGALPTHLLGHRLGVKRTAAEVDVAAVGPDVDLVDGRAQLAEHLRRDVVSGAVGAIDDDLHAVQRQLLRKGVLQELDVAPDRVVDALRLADRVGRGARAVVPAADRLHAAFDLGLDLVGQLVPVGGEDLDAIVLVGIVRRADHHARVRAHRPGDEGDPGCRQRSHQQHVGAGGHDPRLQRALQHVAGETRVLADHDAGGTPRAAELLRHRLPEAQRHLGGHRVAIGDAADAVSSEQLPAAFVTHGFLAY